MSAAELVDRLAGGRVIVFGSTPPQARDLDLLVRPEEQRRLEEALPGEGFVAKGSEWARFAERTAQALDLSPVAEWDLPPGEVDALFEQAQPLDGFEHLCVPAPAFDLLVLAKLLSWAGSFPEKRRARLERALPGWDEAVRRAPAWGLADELAKLRDPPRAKPRPSRPRVVSLSGIDGSGKSTQGKALQAALAALGHDAVIAWAPIASNPLLDAVAKPVKKLASRRYAPPPADEPSGLHRDAGTELRSRSRLVRFAWTTLVAIENGAWHGMTATRAALDGKIVIFDRYVLDSAARMRFQYGAEHRFRLQKLIVRLLSPKPVASFFLELPPEQSLERKDDRWTADELRAQARLYAEEAHDAGVTHLEATRPPEELAATIAEAVWRRL